MAFGKPILSWCEISLVLHRSWSGLTDTLSGIVFTLVLFYKSQFHTGTLFRLQISLSACSRGSCLVKTACGRRPTFTSSGHLPSACWSSSCLNWPALGSLNCLGPGAWEPGGLRSGSNWLRVKHATGRSPTPTCQTRAACGGRGNRMRGIRVVTKKIAAPTQEEGEGDLADLLRHHVGRTLSTGAHSLYCPPSSNCSIACSPRQPVSPSLLTRRAGLPPGSRIS